MLPFRFAAFDRGVTSRKVKAVRLTNDSVLGDVQPSTDLCGRVTLIPELSKSGHRDLGPGVFAEHRPFLFRPRVLPNPFGCLAFQWAKSTRRVGPEAFLNQDFKNVR
jgi:hypothetical protein